MQSEELDRRIKKSKAALKDALLTLIEHKDFEHITVSDIVKQAELNRGTFYKHYPYKEELMNELWQEISTDLVASFRAPYESFGSFEVKSLSAGAVKLFDHVERFSRFYTLLIATNALIGYRDPIYDIFKMLYCEDLSNRTLAPAADRELQASFRAHATYGMISEWVRSGFKYSARYMAEQSLIFVRTNQENDIYESRLAYSSSH